MTRTDSEPSPHRERSEAPTASLVQDYLDRAARFGALLRGAGGRWDLPTPCSGWTVRDVVEHAIQTERDFLVQRGLLPEQVADGADLAAAWDAHVATVTEVLGRPGVAGTGYDGFFGPTTVAATLADFYGWDLVVHGWDVARATGQPYELEPEEIGWADAAADGWGEALRMEGICGPAVPVPDDASAQDRLVGRLGRDPCWSA